MAYMKHQDDDGMRSHLSACRFTCMLA